MMRYLLLLGVLLWGCQSSTQADTAKYIKVDSGTFELAIELVGDIEAQKQVFLAPFYSAKLEKISEDGSTVKKGDIVAQLESKDVEDSLSDSELSLEVAKNDVAEHIKNMSADQIKARASIQEARKVLAQEQLALRLLLQGAKKEALTKIQYKRDLARKTYEQASSDLKQKKSLLERGIASQLEVLEARLSLTRQNRSYQMALAEYQVTLKGASSFDKQIARLKVTKAKNTLSLELNAQKSEAKKGQLKLSKLKSKLLSLAKKVKRLKEKFRRSVIKAPLGGTVVISKIWANKGLSRAKVGDDMRKGHPFMSLANLDEIVVRTEVGEQYISRLKKGMPCTIRVPSLNQSYAGKVHQIGVLAKERSGRSSESGLNKVFEVALIPTEKTKGFKPGTTVEVKIPLIKQEAVLTLPRQVIFKQGVTNYVRLKDGLEQTVILGAMNTKEVVILKGLKAGQEVYLPESEGKKK